VFGHRRAVKAMSVTPDERERLWPLLYWGPKITHRDPSGRLADPVGVIAELFVAAMIGLPINRQPQHCVNKSITKADRAELARALSRGTAVASYTGWANCRICDVQLGTKDLTGWGFIWPERAEHYITEHEVWTPECSRLLAAVRTT
jgi:hypothetical protein